jgi:hypothetical protein
MLPLHAEVRNEKADVARTPWVFGATSAYSLTGLPRHSRAALQLVFREAFIRRIARARASANNDAKRYGRRTQPKIAAGLMLSDALSVQPLAAGLPIDRDVTLNLLSMEQAAA